MVSGIDHYARLDQIAGNAYLAGIGRFESNRLNVEAAPDWFHAGQLEAWDKEEDTVLLLCGTQSGKTVFQPWWMLREMQRKGPGEYGAASPTFALMFKKLLPEYRRVFNSLELGKFTMSPITKFEFSPEGLMRLFGRDDEPCTVYFCHASNSDSLESMTLKGFASDECGQRAFAATSFEAIERRLAVHSGRHLMGTTPYDWNYLKTGIYDRWVEGDTDIAVVSFSSLMNPTFPKARYERARKRGPEWRFQMMYDGKFTKPAGMIYDCFDRATCCIPRFPIPDSWRRLGGLDFGPVNTAGVVVAHDPENDRYIAYRTYHHGKIDVGGDGGHVENLLAGEPQYREGERKGEIRAPMFWGGSWSEDDWREEFTAAGLTVLRPPVRDVEVGIQLVYALLATGRLLIFDDLLKLIAELETYSREVSDSGDPLMAIADKHSFHRADALRYLVCGIESGADEEPVKTHRNGDNDGKRRQDDDLFDNESTRGARAGELGRRSTGRGGRAFRG